MTVNGSYTKAYTDHLDTCCLNPMIKALTLFIEDNKSVTSVYPSLVAIISCVSSSAKDPRDIPRKLQNSFLPFLAAPSLKLLGTDTAARRTCDVNPYLSFPGNVALTL